MYKINLYSHRILNTVISDWRKKTILIVLFNFLFLALHAEETQTVKQNISVNLKNVSLDMFFKTVEKKSNYIIFFNEDILKGADNVTVKMDNSPVQNILNSVLTSRGLSYTIEDRQIIISKVKKTVSTSESEKGFLVKGVVSDDNGQPLPGVNITVEGRTIGTITDIDGRFTLKLPDNHAEIKASYVGFATKKIVVTPQNKNLTITLSEDAFKVNEVVVVGYGTQKKVNLTGAISVIDGDKLNDRPVQSLTNMLQGVSSGLTVTTNSGRPGNNGAINIRGVNTLNDGNALVLIDGVEADMSRVNPNDVASISVLKDASAAAVYGARAAYGVVLVTTKEGDNTGKTRVSYSGNFGWSSPTTSTDYETRGYYSVMLNDMFMKSYSGTPYTKYTEADYEQLWLRRNDKTENPERPWVVIDQRDGRDTYVYYGNTDWYHHLYKDNRPMMKHSVSLSGGNQHVKYMLSGGYYKEDGIYRKNTDTFTRANFRSKISFDINKWFNISNNTTYFNSNYTYPGISGVNNAFTYDKVHALASYVPLNPDGTSVYNTSFTKYQVMDGYSAILDQGKNKNNDINNNISTITELTYKPFDGLTLKANFNYTFNNNRYYNRNTNVSYSKYPGEISTLTTKMFEDKLSESNQTHNYYATNIYATYEKKIKGHNFKIMGGFNWERKYLKDIKAIAYNLLSERLIDLNLAGIDEEGNGRYEAGGGQNEFAILGGFGRLNYDYEGRYLAEVSGRYDGTSKFKTGYRYGFFPSFSLGWRVSEEKFFEPIKDVFSNFKIRYSLGSLGNQMVNGYYPYIQTINIKDLNSYIFGGAKTSYAQISNPTSSDYTWETTLTNNLGFDLGFFRDKLNFTADLYHRDTKNMLLAGPPLPALYGATSPRVNNAGLRTKGYELALTWRDSFRLLGSTFQYNAAFMFNDNITTITKYDNPEKTFSKSYYEGQRYGEIWGYRVDGYFLSDEEAKNWYIDQTLVNDLIEQSSGAERGKRAGDLKFRDLDGDNKISIGKNSVEDSGDREVIGNEQPRYMYSGNLGFSWYGVDVSAFFQGVGRQDWYPGANCMAFWGPYARPYSTYIPKDFHTDIWSEENPNAYYPRPRGYTALNGTNRELTAVNDKYLQNLAYCRLKNFTIGYTLPSNITKKILIDKLRVFFSGENLVTWTKLRSDYLDPEQCSTDGSGSLARIYPWSKTFTFGIDLTF